MLKEGIKYLERLCCLLLVYIPKSGKDDYSNPRNFRQISLTSFSLKCLERLVKRYIREKALTLHPLNESQHVFQRGKSIESALLPLVSKIEDATPKGEYAMRVSAEIEGVFDSAFFQKLCNDA